MKKTKYEFKGKCSNCKKNFKTNTAEFMGYVGTGQPMGFYAICPCCDWKTKVSAVEGVRNYEQNQV